MDLDSFSRGRLVGPAADVSQDAVEPVTLRRGTDGRRLWSFAEIQRIKVLATVHPVKFLSDPLYCKGWLAQGKTLDELIALARQVCRPDRTHDPIKRIYGSQCGDALGNPKFQ